MRYVDVAAVSPGRVSALGFGCAPLLGRVGRKASLAALHAAYDGGINFFDTARSYGYGESETLLGEFLTGRRDQVVLCTKFGILPAAKGGWKRRLKPLAQAAVGFAPGLRRFARRQAAGQFVAGQFSAAALAASFATSLRELRTDYVDMLLLHDADAAVLEDGELLAAMDELVRAGKVRMAGISGPHRAITAAMEMKPPVLATAQFAVNPAHFGFLEQIAGRGSQPMFLVANHPFGGANRVEELKARIGRLRTEPLLGAELRAKLEGDPGELLPEIVFGCILTGTRISAVIAAMMRPANLRNNLRAIEHCRFSPEELLVLRQHLA